VSANAVILIKTSQNTATPPSLANGELAYSYSSQKLFLGTTANSSVATQVDYIGGKLLVTKVANLESQLLNSNGGVQISDVTITGNATIDQIIFSTYTNNSVLITKAGGVVDFITGASGKVLQIAANGTPVFSDVDGETY
jgi:hypothetical protein